MDYETSETSALSEITAEIVAAYVSNNRVALSEIAGVISSVHESLAGLGKIDAAPVKDEPLVPAVPIKKSVTPDYIVCLEDGKHFKSMKRHLATKFDMSPDEYRRKWGLPNDYPMVAAGYAAKRSELALSLGLGRKKAEAVVAEVKSKQARGKKVAAA